MQSISQELFWYIKDWATLKIHYFVNHSDAQLCNVSP